jgi:hypothetical protein
VSARFDGNLSDPPLEALRHATRMRKAPAGEDSGSLLPDSSVPFTAILSRPGPTRRNAERQVPFWRIGWVTKTAAGPPSRPHGTFLTEAPAPSVRS